MTIQVAVKLPDELVRAVDRLVAQGAFANRSLAVRSALEQLVRHDQRRRIDAAFAEGFARRPEDERELEDARRLAIEAIEDEPWEKWW
jgi:Arc/MetJ-type ribon-helix-helix transcriptional regulator